MTSERIAASVNSLLSQVAYKPHIRIQLQLAKKDRGLDAPVNLLIDSKVAFNQARIRQFTEWLQNPDIHPLNCGVYSLQDIFASHSI